MMILPCRVDADYRHWVLDLRSLQPLVRVGLAAAEPRLFLSPPPFLPLLPRAVWVPLFLLPPPDFLGRLLFLPPRWGCGVSFVSSRAQIGRVGGSQWGWVLQTKFPCHDVHDNAASCR